MSVEDPYLDRLIQNILHGSIHLDAILKYILGDDHEEMKFPIIQSETVQLTNFVPPKIGNILPPSLEENKYNFLRPSLDVFPTKSDNTSFGNPTILQFMQDLNRRQPPLDTKMGSELDDSMIPPTPPSTKPKRKRKKRKRRRISVSSPDVPLRNQSTGRKRARGVLSTSLGIDSSLKGIKYFQQFKKLENDYFNQLKLPELIRIASDFGKRTKNSKINRPKKREGVRNIGEYMECLNTIIDVHKKQLRALNAFNKKRKIEGRNESTYGAVKNRLKKYKKIMKEWQDDLA